MSFRSSCRFFLLVPLSLAVGLSACSTQTPPKALASLPPVSVDAGPATSTAGISSFPSAVSAGTKGLAEITAQWQCSVSKTAYPSQEDIEKELNDRLVAAKRTRAQWESWRKEVKASQPLQEEQRAANKATC